MKSLKVLRKEGWQTRPCVYCGGHGLVSDYGVMATDFEGAKECPKCIGTGRVWLTPQGRHVAYPGGPFV